MKPPFRKLASLACALLLAAALVPATALPELASPPIAGAQPAIGEALPSAEAAASPEAPSAAPSPSAPAQEAPTASGVATAAADAAAGGIAKVADPDTSGSWQRLFDAQSDEASGLAYSTEEAGRIWVDKSVYADEAAAEAGGIVGASLSDPSQNFLVGLSTISAASTVRKEPSAARDVIFVISLNATLASLTYDGRPQAAHLADALNAAIGRLMEENAQGGPAGLGRTRVAVIGYSIDATVLMPLDSYQPDGQGRYLEFSRSLEGGSGLAVVGLPDTAGTRTANGICKGYAYPQRALHEASAILQQAAADAEAEGSARKPTLILMGSETPLTANVNVADPPAYEAPSPESHGFIGSLPGKHLMGFGTDSALALLLTMQNERRLIDEAYAPLGQTLGFYTVGLDTSTAGAYVLQTAQGQLTTDIPYTLGGTQVNLRENIEAARALYAQAAQQGDRSAALPLYASGSGGLKQQDVLFPAPIAGLLEEDRDYAFTAVDAYFHANDAGALAGSFNAAVDHIMDIEYRSPINVGSERAADSTDRFRIRDGIGQAMVVKRVEGIQFQNRLLDGSKAAQAVSKSFAEPWNIEAYHEVQYLMNSLNARYNLGWDAYNLIAEANRAGQFAYRGAGDWSNFISWYADADRNMVRGKGAGYLLALNDELAAAETGSWRTAASPQTKSRMQSAIDAGAASICQTYFYIGNLENQYTGDDVPLYDFVVMVETDLETGGQTLLLTIPADSIPARKAYVTEQAGGQAVMQLDEDALSTYPLRLVYEAGPRDDVAKLVSRMASGDEVADEDIKAALGRDAAIDTAGNRLLYTNAFTRDGQGVAPDAVMTSVTAATNGYYSFTKDTPLLRLKAGQSAPPDGHPAADQLEPLASAPKPGQICYYLDTYYQAQGLSADGAAPAEAVREYKPYEIPLDEDEIARHFLPNREGQYCAMANTPKFKVSAVLDDYGKSANPTATTPYAKKLSVTEYRPLNRSLLTALLGNNGALILSPARKGGSLTVEKRLAARGTAARLTADDRAQSFAFSLSLETAQGAPLSGMLNAIGAEGAPSGLIALDERGRASFSLKDGQSLTFKNLPATTRFRVEEQPDENGFFLPSHVVSEQGAETAADKGAIAEGRIAEAGAATATFTNTRESGALRLSKATVGNAADPTRAFPFSVALVGPNGAPLSGEFPYELSPNAETDAAGGGPIAGAADGGIATADGAGILALEGGALPSLADGQSLTIGNLPAGTAYTVREVEAEGYETRIRKTIGAAAAQASDGKGVIAADLTDALSFENERWAYGTLSLSKQVAGTEGDRTRKFLFDIALSEGSGAPLSGTVDYRLANAAGQETNGSAALDDAGSFSIALEDGQTLTLDKLPQGTRYAIEEADYSAERYIVKASNAEGVIGPEPSEARFVNVKQAGALGIAKIVGGNAGDRKAPYSFTVMVEGLFADQPETATTRSFEATRYRADGGSEPTTVTFARAEGAAATRAADAANPQAADAATTTADNDESTAGEAVEEDAAPAKTTAGTAGIAVIENIHHNEGILIEGLHSDAPFAVTENGAEALAADGYAVYAGADGQLSPGCTHAGTLTPDKATGVYFANVKNLFGNLSIAKEAVGNAARDEAEAGRLFEFVLSLKDGQDAPVSGEFPATLTRKAASGAAENPQPEESGEGEGEGDAPVEEARSVVFREGVARVALPAPATLAISGLPAGSSYAVAEQNLAPEGYAVEAHGAAGVIEADRTAEASFANRKSYTPVEVAVSGMETLRGRNEAAGEFAFQLYGEDGASPVLDSAGNPIIAVNRAAEAGTAVGFTLRGAMATEPGTYAYVVRERVPDGTQPLPGVSYDQRSYQVAVTVSADARGALYLSSIEYRVDGQTAHGISFVNEYRTSSGSFSLEARKILTGRPLEAGAFLFAAQEVDPSTEEPLGNTLVAGNDADGAILFGTLSSTVPLGGEMRRSFVVSERLPATATADTGYAAGGVRYDTAQYRVDVIGRDAGGTGSLAFASSILKRTLQADGSYGPWQTAAQEGPPLFANSYNDEAAVFSGLVVEKELSGRDWQEGDAFTFVLRATSAVGLDGKPLATEMPLPASPAMTIGAFDAAAQLATAAGDAVRKPFGPIAFTEPGIYEYSLSEQAADGSTGASELGIDYSSALYRLSISVASDGRGSLVATPTLRALTDDRGTPLEPNSEPSSGESGGGLPLDARFGNRYADAAFASFDGAVDYADESGLHPLADGMFGFRIEAVGQNREQAPKPAFSSARNAGGLFTFGSAEIPHDDSLIGQTFRYEARQIIPDGAQMSEDGATATLDGMIYDARIRTIALSVMEETLPDGHRLAAFVIYPEGEDAFEGRVVFHNRHTAEDPGGGGQQPGGGEDPGGEEPGGGGGEEPGGGHTPGGGGETPGGGGQQPGGSEAPGNGSSAGGSADASGGETPGRANRAFGDTGDPLGATAIGAAIVAGLAILAAAAAARASQRRRRGSRNGKPR